MPGGLSAGTDYYVIKTDANHFKLATSASNAEAGIAVNIASTGSGTLQVSANTLNAQISTNAADLSVKTQSSAKVALPLLDDQLRRITAERGSIGSTEDRLGVALSNLHASREEYSRAAAQIFDADIAEESAELTCSSIRQNIAVAIMGQANLVPALAQKLLSNL